MAIIRAIPKERAQQAVLTQPSGAVGQAVSTLGKQIAQVEQQVNSANRSRRVNEASVSTSRAISDHEADLASRPTDFESYREENTKFLSGLKKQLITNAADQPERDRVVADFDRAAVSSQARVRQKSRSLSIQAGKAALSDAEGVLSANYAELESEGDRADTIDGFNQMIDQAVLDGMQDPNAAVKRKELFVTIAEKNRAYRDIDSDPKAVIRDVESNAYRIAEGDRRSILNAARRGVAAQEVQLRRDQAKVDKRSGVDEAWEFVELMDRGEQNLLQAEAIEQFRVRYAGTRAGAREWLQLRKKFSSTADDVLAQRAVINALEGQGFISPDDPDQMAAADDVYKSLLGRWSIEEIPSKVATFAARLGVVPKSLRNSIIGPLGTMQDPDAAIIASNIVAEMLAKNPSLQTAFHSKHIEKAVELRAYSQSGLSPRKSVDLFNQVRAVADPVRTARDKEFSQFVRDGDYEDQIRSAVQDTFGDDRFFDVDIPPELVARAEKLARDTYTVHGNFDVAINQAAVVTKGRWATSLMDNDLLQLDAPGLYYAAPGKDDEGNREWQTEQLLEDIRSNVVMRELAARTDQEYIVTSNPTKRAPNGKPVYSIAGIDSETGTILHIGDWVPDYQSSPQFKLDIEDQDAVMKQLYKDRAEFLAKPRSRRDRRLKRSGGQ